MLLALFSLEKACAEGPLVSSMPAQPIETHMDLGLFGLLGGSMEYSVDSKKITRYEDFKFYIYPIRDAEASQLIREAEADHFAAEMFYGSGIVCGLDVALFLNPTPFVHVDWIDRIGTGVFVAQLFVAVGALFDTNGEGRKYNAVQRYNHLALEKKETFLGLTPQVDLGQKSPEFVLSKTF